MHLYYRNVNDAFTSICRGFTGEGFDFVLPDTGRQGPVASYRPTLSRGPSRYGSVIRVEEPVTITYTQPLERVLFHPVRNCNPFFHLIEALWMLAGQNRVQPLTHFAKRIAEFSDDDLTAGDIPYRGNASRVTDMTPGLMWGAYGYRWRSWFKWDQLESIIAILRSDRTTRRVVLDMWEPRDLQRVQTDPNCKDVPCNLMVMFSPRASTESHRLHCGQDAVIEEEPLDLTMSSDGRTMTSRRSRYDIAADIGAKGCTLLDMTVINRSNDTLWGALGSNYVHFSFLLEYVANAVGMAVGQYHQITNNLHVYSDKALGQDTSDAELWSNKWVPADLCNNGGQPYSGYNHYPLFRAPINSPEQTDIHRRSFDNACLNLFNHQEYVTKPLENFEINSQAYFEDVVKPMLLAWQCHKSKDYTQARLYANRIVPKDWRLACVQWLQRTSDRTHKAE